MRVLLLGLPGTDHSTLRTALGAALGAATVDVCHAVEAAVTWLENRPCDLVAVAGPAPAARDGLARLRRASRALPLLALLPETTSPEAGAAWLAGADDVLPISSLIGATPPEGLDEVRTADRDLARRIQKLWYAGPSGPLRQQLLTRLSSRCREVGLSGEGLSGLTTQDFEAAHSAALVVDALDHPDAMVLGVRRVKRTYPALAVTVVADGAHHEAFRRAGADECIAGPADPESVLVAAVRAQARCRTAVEADALRARESRLRGLVEQLPEAVVLVSPEHAVLAVNVAGLRLIGAHDARQVLGAPLAPWVAADADDALTTLVESVSGGATREMVAATAQLPTPRRLLIRAVPFQRESGGRPAALMVLRDLANEPVAPTQGELGPPLEAANQTAWAEERQALVDRVSTLEAELAAATALTGRIRTLEDALQVALDREQAVAPALQTAARLEGFGVDVDRIPALLEAASRLRTLEEQDLPALQARVLELDALERDVVPVLRAQLAEARATAVTAEQLDTLHRSAERLREIEHDEMPALRAVAAEQTSLHDRAVSVLEELRGRVTSLEKALADAREAAALAAATQDAAAATPVVAPTALDAALERIAELEGRLADAAPQDEARAAAARIAELEDQLTEAAVHRMALQADAGRAQELEQRLEALVHVNLALEADVARLAAPVAAAPVAASVAPEQEWLLEEVAALGVVHTSPDGLVISANAHAARACGLASGDDLVRAGRLPAPLRALAGDDDAVASRFEVCLQGEDDVLPRWVAGVRLPRQNDQPVAWWLVDVTPRQPLAAREQVRVQAMSSVLEVATAECANLIATPAARPLGPRPLDAMVEGERAETDAAAVARAHVMLGQLTALGKRRSTARAENLQARLTTLAPLLGRLAGDDVTWSLTLPDTPVHACVAGAEFDRCVTTLVTSGRDALPLGGCLTLTLHEDAPGAASTDVRRPASMVSVTLQGYGRTDVEVPGAVTDIVAGMGGRVEVTTTDAMAAEIRLRLPRAFLLVDAA